jgi:hypothetical protein
MFITSIPKRIEREEEKNSKSIKMLKLRPFFAASIVSR